MIVEMKHYRIRPRGQYPRLEDIQECINIATKEHCLIELSWYIRYSGEYKCIIDEHDNAEETFQNKIPHTYGV